MIEKKLLLLTSLLPLSAFADNRPNIIYICTDQQTATAMSCMGNTDLKTPNMDRLADAGMIFRNAYCSAPLSGPSRTAMFTGYYPHEIGVTQNAIPIPDYAKETSLGLELKAAGYECIYAGKWHVHTSSMPDTGEFGFKVIHPHNDHGLAEDCVKYLDGRDKKDKTPFFLVASFDNPHNACEYARQMNLPFENLEEPDLRDCPGLPKNHARNPYDADVIQHEQTMNYHAYPTVRYDSNDWRRYRYGYFRLVETVDAEIGKIVDAIDRNDLWKNTVIIFSSDHGDGTGAHHWNQKSALYEEVVNIPFIVTLPGKRHAGTEMKQLINNGIDLHATLCDIAGIEKPEGTLGTSFKELVYSGDPDFKHQEYVVTETMFDKGDQTRGWCVRTENYKYVLYEKGRFREQLFDMNEDRGEMRNLAIERKYADVLEHHRTLLHEWMVRNNVKVRGKVNPVPGF